ncbi:MAG: sialate O-acetylesterase [Candidatus Solibacter sp.]
MSFLRFLPLFAIVTGLRADVTLPPILSNHMILQRGVPTHLWGKAAPGESVTATFRGASATAKADPVGKWSLYLPAGEAGGPFPLTVQAANTIAYDDVLVGDVWVASGQSNIELPLIRSGNAQAEIKNANFPKIRRTRVDRKTAEYPLDEQGATPWTATTPENAGGMSGVAYYFARHIQETQQGVPVGIIESFWGGTPVEAWTSLRAIAEDPGLMPMFANWARVGEGWGALTQKYEMDVKQWEADSAKAKAEGKAAPRRPGAPFGGPGGPKTPASLYNAMIAPIVAYPIKGVIWYQGEGNARPALAPVYARNFMAMIRDWRRAWGLGDFPFIWAQLPNYKENGWWPDLREAQLQSLALANTGMAVTIDVGAADNLHPPNKKDVGVRMAIAARGVAYGEKIEWSGPLYRTAAREGGAMRVWFDHTGRSMEGKGGALKGFEVAGADKKFVAAEARIEGNTVVVSSSAVADPAFVRYDWDDAPEGNLYNSEGLPASPFRSN